MQNTCKLFSTCIQVDIHITSRRTERVNACCKIKSQKGSPKSILLGRILCFRQSRKSSEVITGEINHKACPVISLTAGATCIVISSRKGRDEHLGKKQQQRNTLS